MRLQSIRKPALVYLAVSITLLAFPVFGVLHAESSAVIAFAGFFISGLATSSAEKKHGSLLNSLKTHLGLLAIPYFVMMLGMFFRPNCTPLTGTGIFLLFSLGSVILGCALGYLVSVLPVKRKKTLFVLSGLGLSLAGVIYDLGFHPQFFTYNHVFGGVLGPVYEEDLHIRPGLLFFRLMTLLWAWLLYGVARWYSRKKVSNLFKMSLLFSSIALVVLYIVSDRTGVNMTAGVIQAELGGHAKSAHFDIYYDPDSIDGTALDALIYDHEYLYERLKTRIGETPGSRIQSYIYPSPKRKRLLTGAGYTSVAPVWLRQPQMHMLQSLQERVLSHELAHVFSRSFGLPLLKASFSVGLVEGFAEAMEVPNGRPSLDEQVAVAYPIQKDSASKDTVTPASLEHMLSPFGFWTGRGAVSYTTMGSFVSFLINTYGISAFKRVYPRSAFEQVYGKPVKDLVYEWLHAVHGRTYMDRDTRDFTFRRFSVPSLFEKTCPHYVAPVERLFEAAEEAIATEDSARAFNYLDQAVKEDPLYENALIGWSQMMLARQQPVEVLDAIQSYQSAFEKLNEGEFEPALNLIYADALTQLDRRGEAYDVYTRILTRLPFYAHEQRAVVMIRIALVQQDLPKPGILIQYGCQQTEETQDASALSGLVRALRCARKGSYEDALDWLNSVNLEALDLHFDNHIARQMDMWRAAWYYQDGRYEEARYYAEQVTQDFEQRAAVNLTLYWEEFVKKLDWVETTDVYPD